VNGSLIITARQKAKYRFDSATILLFRLLHEESTRRNVSYFLKISCYIKCAVNFWCLLRPCRYLEYTAWNIRTIDGWWIANDYGTKRPWPTRGTVPEFSWSTWRNPHKISVMTAGVPPGNWKSHLQSTSPRRCRCTIQLGADCRESDGASHGMMSLLSLITVHQMGDRRIDMTILWRVWWYTSLIITEYVGWLDLLTLSYTRTLNFTYIQAVQRYCWFTLYNPPLLTH
jgi:hypothetical protein